MKQTLLIGCCLFQLAAFGQQNFQVPLDYTFATQGIDGPNNYANGGSLPTTYDGTSALNWFSTPNTAIQLTTSQSCVFPGNSSYQPTDNFSLVIRAKIDMDDVAAITGGGKSYTLWSNGPHFLAMTDDGNGDYVLSGGVKNGGPSFGYQVTNLSYNGLLANAIDAGWVTFYLVYEQNTQTGNSSLNLSFNGYAANDNSATTTETALLDLAYDNPTNEFVLGANPNDQDVEFKGMIDYCYFYNYRLSLAQRDQFDATVCEKLTVGSTTLTPKEPYDANLTYDWCSVTNPGSGDVFTSTGVTTFSFTPTTSGTYMCKIGFGGIYTTYTEYAAMTISSAGLQESALDEFQIYPNPASSTITIENSVGANITIRDLAGKQVKTVENNTDSQVTISDLKQGVYLVYLEKNGNLSFGRFIKE